MHPRGRTLRLCNDGRAPRQVLQSSTLRWKPINNGAQPRQFVRMLFLHLNHGLNGSPRIAWIKPTRIMDYSVSDEYVERQRVADEKSDEATSARIVQWYVCWAADYLINTEIHVSARTILLTRSR
jgi:hypothetical protein